MAPTFPAVPVPTIDPGALYASVMALKQGYELMIGGGGLSLPSLQTSVSSLVTSSGGWNNRGIPIYAAYTVGVGDLGGTLVLGGGTFFPVTLAAASTYPNGFLVVVTNTDTTRGKLIRDPASPVPLPSFILWPLQTVVLFVQNGVWYTLPQSQRWSVPGVTTLNVDISVGNDNNDGLATGAGNALKTIQAAVNTVFSFFDIGVHLVIILVVGSPTESVQVNGPWVGSGNVFIKGDLTTPSNVTWACATGNPNVFANTQGRILVGGIKFKNTISAALLAQNGGGITGISNAEFGNCVGGHLVASQSGTINLNAMGYTISDDGSTATSYHALLSAFGEIFNYSNTVTLTGTPKFSGAFAFASGGYLFAPSNTYSGAADALAQKYIVAEGGTIIVNGAGVNYFPGGVAGSGGTTAGGGYYL